MLFSRRKEIISEEIKPSLPAGFIVLIIGLSTFLLGTLHIYTQIQEFSLIIILHGIILLYLGINYFQKLFLPVTYLLFASTIFFVIPENISYFLQLVSTKITFHVLNLLNLDILMDGTFIRLPATTLQVIDLCSGYNQIFTMVALFIPYAYMSYTSAIKQTILICICIPVAMIMNGIRIICIALYNYSNTHSEIHGPFEIFRMPFIFIGGLLVVILIAKLFFKPDPHITLSRTKSTISNLKPFYFAIAITLTFTIVITFFISLKVHIFNPQALKLPKSWHIVTNNIFKYSNIYGMNLGSSTDISVLGVTNNDSLLVSIFSYHKLSAISNPFIKLNYGEGFNVNVPIDSQVLKMHIKNSISGRSLHQTAIYFINGDFYFSSIAAQKAISQIRLTHVTDINFAMCVINYIVHDRTDMKKMYTNGISTLQTFISSDTFY
jgi:exosortase